MDPLANTRKVFRLKPRQDDCQRDGPRLHDYSVVVRTVLRTQDREQ